MAGRALLSSSHAGIHGVTPLSASLYPATRWLARSLSLRPRASASISSAASADESKPFVLTTPLYYVNAPPHMGSAYTTIAADAISRFQRLLGKEVIFITGTDEHGEKIATAAASSGNSPSEHCDAISHAYRMLWKDLDIAYDKFIRTTNPSHEAVVKEFYSRVFKNGDIYKADYEGLYCVNCEEYKDEKELLENNCCPMHLKPCVLRKEDNYFFALSKYQKALEEMLTCSPESVKPSFRLNEVQGWIKNGLRDFSISRSSVEWGIPVPNDEKQTIYVWFDALLGYISALLEDGEEPSLQKAVNSGWPASLHLIGKDILRFHAVYWPAMLMSAGLSLPNMVFGHGFLTKDGLKMGKSLGNTLEPKDLVRRFGPDAVRYFFLREVEFGNDGDYSEDRFISIVNAHLANTIGNLLNRTLGLLKKNCQSTLAKDSTVAAEGNYFRDTVEKLINLKKVQVEDSIDIEEEANVKDSSEDVERMFASRTMRDSSIRCYPLPILHDTKVLKDAILVVEERTMLQHMKPQWEVLLEAISLVEKARINYENLSLSSACESVLEIGNAGNLYMDEHAPWSRFKQGGASSEAAAQDLVIILEAMRIVAIALSPVAPRLCLRIYTQLGFSKDQFEAVIWDDTRWGGLKAGQVMAEPKPVFARIETTKEGEESEVAFKTVKDKKGVPKKQGLVEA